MQCENLPRWCQECKEHPPVADYWTVLGFNGALGAGRLLCGPCLYRAKEQTDLKRSRLVLLRMELRNRKAPRRESKPKPPDAVCVCGQPYRYATYRFKLPICPSCNARLSLPANGCAAS